MTRPVHEDTDVQRAEAGEEVSQEERERGYEQSDVPAGKVALGLGGLLGLIVLGLAFGWSELSLLLTNEDRRSPPFANVELLPPEPRLLTGPNRDTRRFSHPPVDATSLLPPAPIRRAMEEVARQGWNEQGALPAPATQAVAREHRERAR